jgi:hypothetical protein
MTNTEIERLGALILKRAGMPTHVTVLSPWHPLLDRMAAHYQEMRRIARLWQQVREESERAL